jgi:hypothetical protein
MEVICLQEEAFYELVETVVNRLSANTPEVVKKWIGTEETMEFLNIKSKTTLQKLRDEGLIRFTQPQKRIILYDRESLESYLNQNAHNTF